MLVEGVSGLESPEILVPTVVKTKLGWWRSPSFKIYLGHTLSSWGDRMWGFAVGLYMVILFPDSLMLAAIYGFSNCLSGIIFGPYIGAWIDRTQRITAARCALVTQNFAVVLGAVILTITIHFRSDIKSIWDGKLEYVLYAVIILVALVADLASVASKIALEKDWIVVLAGGDGKKLASLNSTMRTINLTTSILAPIVVGQIIHFGSQVAGAAFIAIWNCISALVEYNLLYQIYKMVPQLGAKSCNNNEIPFIKISSPDSDSNNTPNSAGGDTSDCSNNANYKTPEMVNNFYKGHSTSASLLANEDGSTLGSKNRVFISPGSDFEDISLVTPISMKKNVTHRHLGNDRNRRELFLAPTPQSACNVTSGRNSQYHQEHPRQKKESPNNTTTASTITKVKSNQGWYTAWKGWKSYFSHHVKFAGLGLACLYMTVLGFDSITTGFIYSQGVNESLIGILTAVGAVFGILGSLSFPILRRKLGKNKTGILGFSLESLFLLLCVGSVFAIGSPFRPTAILKRFENVSGSSSSYTGETNRSFKEIWEKEGNVILLMVGIIIARYGLWIADLSVTQIFQEEVEESQRGIINGVQDSLNKFMDLLKFALVILLPSPETFGFLIMTSWLFVFIGTLSFLGFARMDQLRRKQELNRDDHHSYNQDNNNIISTISAGIE